MTRITRIGADETVARQFLFQSAPIRVIRGSKSFSVNLLQSGPGPAAFNMALDEALLDAVSKTDKLDKLKAEVGQKGEPNA